MPKLFKISNGPWNKLFEGKFVDHEVDIYSNPDSIMLVLIWDKKGDKYKGAVVELFKVFASLGETENFVETLPREVLVLTKHSQEETIKFFLLGGTPSYIKYDENTFIREVDEQLKRLGTSSAMIKDVSKAYDLTLKDLREADESIKNAFFAQPLLVPVVATATHAEVGATHVSALGTGEFFLGLTQDKNKVIEPISLFLKTMITGGKVAERAHFLHLLIEGSLLSGIPVVAFDQRSNFDGLGQASKDHAGLQKYLVEDDPIGFPTKHFYPTKQVYADLEFVSPEGLIDIFGVGDSDVSKLIIKIMRKEPAPNMEELISKIRKFKPEGDSPTAFEIFKAARVLTLIDSKYPGLFGGKNNLEELSKSPSKGIGRVGLIHLEESDLRSAIIIVHNIMNGLLQLKKKKGAMKNVKLVAVIPNAEQVIPKDNTGVYANELANVLTELNKYGIAFAMGADSIIDIVPAVAKINESKINVVGGNEVGVQLKSRKSYRVLLRPSLSTCES